MAHGGSWWPVDGCNSQWPQVTVAHGGLWPQLVGGILVAPAHGGPGSWWRLGGLLMALTHIGRSSWWVTVARGGPGLLLAPVDGGPSLLVASWRLVGGPKIIGGSWWHLDADEGPTMPQGLPTAHRAPQGVSGCHLTHNRPRDALGCLGGGPQDILGCPPGDKPCDAPGPLKTILGCPRVF